VGTEEIGTAVVGMEADTILMSMYGVPGTGLTATIMIEMVGGGLLEAFGIGIPQLYILILTHILHR